ncbi:MAG: hypothetical protein ACR2FF_09970 [Mycobacteriales bacterium]|nr:MAG: hypothetical protein DLM56_09420 [Pseudonocardiales bacterium]
MTGEPRRAPSAASEDGRARTSAGEAVAALVTAVHDGVGGPRDWSQRLVGIARVIARSAHDAGVRGAASGRVLVDTMSETAPRLPIRTRPVLLGLYPGRSIDDIGEELARVAARSTAAIGAAAGALAAVEFAAPPTLLAAPVQVAAETVAVAAVEVKLVAELHELYGAQVPTAAADRTAAYLMAWARQRAIGPGARGVGGLRQAATRELKSRLLRRMGRNVTSLAPFFAGAVAGAELNRRSTRTLAGRIIADLRAR